MQGNIAVIIGGTGQIGAHIAKTLSNRDYSVICISNHSELQAQNEITHYAFDMSNPEKIEECCLTLSKKYQKINLLINALGKNYGSSLYDIDEETWDEIISVNLKSVFFICRSFRKLLLDGRSSIINFASTAGIRPLPHSPHYIAAKAGVIALTKYFAQVFAPDIRVNCIAPGYVFTENHYPENYSNYNDVIRRIPMREMASLEEIAEMVSYLAKAKTITGQTLVIDGGLILSI